MAKQISLTDLAQLKKLMAMTTSTNDHEALAFLRKANAILTKAGLTWTEVLSRTVGTSITAAADDTVDTGGDMPLEEQIERMFDELRGNVNGSFAEFVESVEKQFIRDRYLTPAQRAPLVKAVKQLREKRRRNE